MMMMMMRVGMMITMMMMMIMILVQLLTYHTYHISTTCYLADRTPCFYTFNVLRCASVAI